MIHVHGLTKAFGNQVLFNDVSFTVHKGEKVGLIGRNGHGKSTLLKMILKEVWPDHGEIHVEADALVGSLGQHMNFTQKTVRAEACLGLRAEEKTHEWTAAKMLYGLGFKEADQHEPPEVFSGGFQMRIELAKVLLSKPDILLLDEPTNYLDITSLRWLEQFLQRWKGTFVLVTHDQTFMNRVVTHTMAVHRGDVRKIEGDTNKMKMYLGQEERVHERTRKNEEKKEQKTVEFIKNFRAGARSAGLVQSRIKMLEKKKKLEKLPPIKPVVFRFEAAPFQADRLVQATSLRFGYDEAELLGGVSVEVKPGDRIGIVGPNGRGKSTLLKVIAGEIPPDSGTVKWNKDAHRGYFGQMNAPQGEAHKTVFEALRDAGSTQTDQEIHKLCGSLMFEGAKRHKPLNVLSGGERSRLALGRMMLSPHNVLLLDEPTNHLDMESCEALEKAFAEYEGAIVCVTHDEKLLKGFAKQLYVFDKGEVSQFRGTYENFLRTVGWDEIGMKQDEANKKAAPKEKANKKVRLSKKRERILRPLLRAVTSQEQMIEALEAELEQLNQDIETAQHKGQVLKVGDLSIKIAEQMEAIEKAFTELERVTQVYETEKLRHLEEEGKANSEPST